MSKPKTVSGSELRTALEKALEDALNYQASPRPHSPMTAVEFGEYLARAAESYMDAISATVEGVNRTEEWNALKEAINEFRARAYPPLANRH